MVPIRPAPISWLAAGTSPPSRTTTRCGRGGERLRVRSCAGRGRPAPRRRQRSRSARSVKTSPDRAGARRTGARCWACGSHFTQSHCGSRSGAAATATTRSSGEWKVASWHDDRTGPGRPPVGRSPRSDDPAERAQRHRDRQARHGRVGPHEPAQRDRGHRLEVLDRLGLRRHQLHGELLRPDRDPDLAEVVVGGAPLPQPVRGRDRPQRVRAPGGARSAPSAAGPAARRARRRIWDR